MFFPHMALFDVLYIIRFENDKKNICLMFPSVSVSKNIAYVYIIVAVRDYYLQVLFEIPTVVFCSIKTSFSITFYELILEE